jgi:hypothetical protein
MNDERIAPARSALMTAVLMGIASAMVGYLTLTQWYGPLAPTVSLLALALLLAPLAVVLVAPDLRQIKSQGGLAALGINMIVAAVIAAAVGSSWRGEGLRASLVERAASLSEGRAAEFAMLDSSDGVALRACQWLMERGELSQRRAATATLSRRPTRATTCLSGEIVEGSKQHSARTELVRTWAQALLGETQEAEVGGALIGGLGLISPSDDVAAAALLTCAVNHEDAAYRPLCAEALARNKMTGARLVAVLERVDEPALAQVWQTRLIAYAYHQFGLTPEDKQSALKLGMLTPEVRGFAMARGCDALATDEEGIDAQFKALATASCDVKGEAIRRANGIWGGVCEAQQRAAKSKKKTSVTEVFCSELSQQLNERAVKTAMELVHAAIAEQASALMAGSIHGGNRMENEDRERLRRQMTGDQNMMQMLMTLPPEARADIMASWRAGEEGGVNNMELVSPEQLQMAAEMVAGTDPEGGMSKEDRAAANAMLEEIKKGSEKTRADKKDGRGEVEKRIEAARQGMKEKR